MEDHWDELNAELEALKANLVKMGGVRDIDARNLKVYDRRLHQILHAILSVQPMANHSHDDLTRALHYISRVALGQEDSRIAEQAERFDTGE